MTTTLLPPSTVPTKYWHRLDDGRTQCDLCPRLCKLREGQRGFCFGRSCQDGQIVLTTYGRSSGFCVDPVEKKPLAIFCPARRCCRSARPAAYYTSPLRTAQTAAWVRSVTPILRKTCCTCSLTVS